MLCYLRQMIIYDAKKIINYIANNTTAIECNNYVKIKNDINFENCHIGLSLE